jgi:hypothetical protein
VAATTLTATAGGSPNLNQWYLVVPWYDGSQLSIQANNGTVNSTTYNSGVYDGSAQLGVGARRDTLPNYWSGRIDAVGLWKRALSAGERTSLYNGTLGCQHPFWACGGQTTVPPAGQTWKLYYYTNGQRIAERVLTSSGSNTLYYLHGDHLGSMSVVTCGSGCPGGVSAGTVTGRQTYYAYGATRVDGTANSPCSGPTTAC